MRGRSFSTSTSGSAKSEVATQIAKVLHYNIQTKDYQLLDIESLSQYFKKQNITANKLYLLRDYPAASKDESLLIYKGTSTQQQ